MSNSEKGAIERRRLAVQGPRIVSTVVRQTVLKMKAQREPLNGFMSGPYVEIYITLIFNQATDLLLEMLPISPQTSQAVVQQLISLMQDKDAGVRALACIFAGLPGMPPTLVAKPLSQQLQIDEDFVVQLAAATHLQGHREIAAEVSPTVYKQAYQLVASYLDPPSMKDRNETIDENRAELHRTMLIARFPHVLVLQDEVY